MMFVGIELGLFCMFGNLLKISLKILVSSLLMIGVLIVVCVFDRFIGLVGVLKFVFIVISFLSSLGDSVSVFILIGLF